jgi:squalene-associated FAD-dependent desaturase
VLSSSPSEDPSPAPSLPPPAPGDRVLIVGGGLAGLSSAAALAGRGLKITLLESRPRLGGRASSFNDPATGEPVDNCQHVSMACCTNLADFCRRVGTSGLFRREPAVVFLGPDGRISRLRAGLLPAPLHLAGSFLRARYLSLSDKVRVAYGLARLRRMPVRGEYSGESFADWLLRHGQTARTMNRYWATVLVSALNERLEQMDVGHARKVFLDGFLRNRHGFQMEIPLVPLGELYGTRLESWLRAHQIEVRLTTGVRSIEADARGVALRSGERIAADFLVLAVPFDRVRGLIPNELAPRIPGLVGLEALQASPITGVHLWFDRPVCPLDHVVTVGRLIQWVFNHTAIQGRGVPAAGSAGETQGQYLQLVISAAYDLLPLDNAAILAAVLSELSEIWPEARSARLLRSWVVTEHGATFAVRPGVDALRPPQRTPVAGLFLAGDWTSTGWPATMEGAVRSGYRAAEGILQDLGRPESLVRPGLATTPLARWLLGPSPDDASSQGTPARAPSHRTEVPR